MHPREVTDVIRRMRGFRIDVNPAYGMPLPCGWIDTRRIVIRNTRRLVLCSPSVYLDGVRFGDPGTLDIDDLPVDALEAVATYPAESSSCGSIMLWSRQPEPGEGSPFELGVRFGGALAGNSAARRRLGLHLVTPLIGPAEFYSAFHLLWNGAPGQVGPANSSWQAHLAARVRPFPASVPAYLGTGVYLFKPWLDSPTNWADGVPDIEVAHTVFASMTVELGPARPFAEVHVLDVFWFSGLDLQTFVGLGFQL